MTVGTRPARQRGLPRGNGGTRALARLVARGRAADLPPAVLHQANRCLVDWLAVTVAGHRHASARILAAHATSMRPAPEATMVGRGRTAAPFAALVNGQSAHVLDFDDTYARHETTLHGAAPILSAAMAVGEARGASGREILNAFSLGFEAAIRTALALGPDHYDLGWHVTGTVGRIGAAAAAARLLRSDEARTATALGLAGTRMSGLKAVYGTMGKAFHAGSAAHDGVLVAHLAARGFTCVDDAIEARHGVLDLYTRHPSPERLRTSTGARFAVLDDGFKPYPCGSLIHAAIDAVLEAVGNERVDPSQVEQVVARVNHYTVTVTGRADPKDPLEAKFSTPYCIASALVRRRGLTLADLTPRAIADPRVRAMRSRIRLVAVEGHAKEQAGVSIHLRDGRVLRAEVRHARGTRGRPLTDDELSAKLRECARPVLGRDRAEQLVDAAWAFPKGGDARALLALTLPARRR